MSGLYLHIPFCRKRCTYCDFHFSTTFENYRTDLIAALGQELYFRKNESQSALRSIYFGGGTPSLLHEKELQSIFKEIHQHYELTKDCEITLEANPEDINEANLMAWSLVGINRLSIGLQTLSDGDLQWMNRAHSVQDGIRAIALAQRFGFENISVDLIYGLPGLSLDFWKHTLKSVLELGIQHLSAYCLTVEPKTALNYMVRTKKLQPANEVLQSDQFMELVNQAQMHGFEHYEISNFSLPGLHSKHNSSYWQFLPYIGVGPSAHSFDGKMRRWNIRNNTQYIRGVGKNDKWFDCEILTPNELRNEQILLGLRTKWGLDLNRFSTHWTKKESAQILQFARLNWIKVQGSTLLLTDLGKLHADGIAAALFRLD